jgi:hypothetical protein
VLSDTISEILMPSEFGYAKPTTLLLLGSTEVHDFFYDWV